MNVRLKAAPRVNTTQYFFLEDFLKQEGQIWPEEGNTEKHK
jgi:hypothetical protein